MDRPFTGSSMLYPIFINTDVTPPGGEKNFFGGYNFNFFLTTGYTYAFIRYDLDLIALSLNLDFAYCRKNFDSSLMSKETYFF